MKKLLLSLGVLALSVTTVTAFGAKDIVTDIQPLGYYAWAQGPVHTSDHRAHWDVVGAGYCVSGPLHRSSPYVHGLHWHPDYQSMHVCDYYYTPGNWWAGGTIVWQLKRSWCACETWGGLNCMWGNGNIKAYCWFY